MVQLQLPMSHPTALPQGHPITTWNIVNSGTNPLASSTVSVWEIVMPVAQSGTEGEVLWRAAKPGRNTRTKHEESTKLDTVQHSPTLQAKAQNLIQKQELPLMPLLHLQSRDFPGRKAAPVTLIYRHANIFLLAFCWCNIDHVRLQPAKAKLPAGSRKAEINLVSHR